MCAYLPLSALSHPTLTLPLTPNPDVILILGLYFLSGISSTSSFVYLIVHIANKTWYVVNSAIQLLSCQSQHQPFLTTTTAAAPHPLPRPFLVLLLFCVLTLSLPMFIGLSYDLVQPNPCGIVDFWCIDTSGWGIKTGE